jgi:hypothetical protein
MDAHEEFVFYELAADIRSLICGDFDEAAQSAMVGSAVDVLGFAKAWIARQRGLPTEMDLYFRAS